MKPALFDYVRPTSLEEAVSELAASDGEGKVLAGGQSLVPLLSMRLARPSVLIDLNRIGGLDYILAQDGTLRIGALTRHRSVELSADVRRCAPLVSEALRYVGHVTIRNRGTIGGSVAHADPAAELPSVLRALDAELVAVGPGGERVIPAAEFFLGYLTTALEPDEILSELRIPVQPPGVGVAVVELARRSGDFALVAVFGAVTVQDGSCTSARLAVAGTSSEPVRASEAEALLVGNPVNDDLITVAAAAAGAQSGTVGDIHASALYRKDMARLLAKRALIEAFSKANGGSVR